MMLSKCLEKHTSQADKSNANAHDVDNLEILLSTTHIEDLIDKEGGD